MCVEPVLPVPQLGNPLIAVFVLFVTVWSRRIVDIIPMLCDMLLFLVLLPLFAPASLTLLPSIEPIDVVIICRSPVRKRAFDL